MYIIMNSITKFSELIKKYICDEWCPQIAKYKKEREFIRRDIVEFLRFHKSKMLYKFGPIGKIRINVNGKSYVVDFMEDNIYIDAEQYFIPYDRQTDLLGEDDEVSVYIDVFYDPYEAVFYKNFTNNYEDIKVILRTVDQYLTNQQTTKNSWNMEQKIKKVFNYIMNAKKTYTDFSFLNYISNSQNSCLFLDSNDISNCKNNYYEQFGFGSTDLYYYSDDFLKFCNDILVLNKNLYNRNEDNYFYARFDPRPRYSYKYKMYIELKNFISFLKYFDINKKIFPIINSEEEINKYYREVFFLHPNEQEQEIKKLFKKVDPKLLNLVKVKLQQNNYNYKKFKNSLHFNFSEADINKLFYNPRIFYVPLPEDLSSICGYKVSMYVVNSMFSTGDIKRRKINIQNVDNIENIDSRNVFSHIKIKFCLDHPYNDNNKFTFSLSLDKYLSLFKLNKVNDIYNFYNFIISCDDYDCLYNGLNYDFREMRYLEGNLLPFIAANKSRLLSPILNKMEEHVDMGKTYVKSSGMSLSDMFLVAHAEDYFDNCVQKM